MVYDDLLRQVMLAATGGVFLFFALWATAKPSSLAAVLG
jgi:hypothetical protein